MRYSIIFASLAVVAFAAPVPQSQQANAEAEFIDREPNVEALPKDDTTWSKGDANADPIIFNNRPDFEVPSNNGKESRSAEPTVFNGGRWSEKKPNKPNKNNGQRRSAAALNDEALEFVDVEIHDQDEIDFDTDSGAGNVPRAFNCGRCRSTDEEQPSSEAVDPTESVNVAGNRTPGPRIAEAESEASLDTSFGTNHVHLQRSAEPKPEALPDRRPAPPHGKPGRRAIPSAVEEDVNGDVFQS